MAAHKTRRERRLERVAALERERPPAQRLGGGYGERPPSPFGGLPVSEVAIAAGAVGVLIGILNSGGPALIVGIVVCALGVVEVTAREHLSGYRSHSVLLAAIPAVAVEAGVALAFRGAGRVLVLVVVVPVFAILFLVLRRRFRVARQARMARPAQPPGRRARQRA